MGFIYFLLYNVTYFLAGRWPGTPEACAVWTSLDVTFSEASILHLCLLSLDRYFAIAKPFSKGTRKFVNVSDGTSCTKHIMLRIFLVWVLAFGKILPLHSYVP